MKQALARNLLGGPGVGLLKVEREIPLWLNGLNVSNKDEKGGRFIEHIIKSETKRAIDF